MSEERRKRGRPRKNETNGSASTETTSDKSAAEAAGGTAGGTPERIDYSEIPEVNLVEVEVPAAGSEDSDVPKPKKAKKQSKKASIIEKNNITALVSGLFAIVSLRAGEDWQISQAEAESISNPLCNMLEKMDIAEKVANVSDGAVLLVALFTIIAPRMITAMSKKKLKEQEKIKQVTGGSHIAKVTEIKTDSKQNNAGAASTKSDGDFIKAITTAAY